MKKFAFLFALIAMLSFGAVAERVTPENALKVAQNFLQANGVRSNGLIDLSKAAGFPNLYIFNGTEGFVVMSADDCVRPILGYSTTNSFKVEGMPDNLRDWLQSYSDEIEAAVAAKVSADFETKQQWVNLLNGTRVVAATHMVGPLITTRWNQGSPYNNLCPTIGNQRCITGCVATAMAQIMNYWKFPSHGMGSNSYQWEDQTLSVDFGNTTYDWNNMLDSYNSTSTDEQKLAVATLMYSCGVSVNMDYGTGGSGAVTEMVASSIVNFFGYKPTTAYLEKNDYEDSEWKDMLKAELDARRPLQYRGPGHSFVCDGYDSEDKFHFNWGWSGGSDGYYALNALTPGSYNFTDGQAAIFGIQPNGCQADEPTNLVAVKEGNAISLSWNAGNGAVAYAVYRNEQLLTDEVTETRYSDADFSFGANVYYVRSIDEDGNMSLISNVETVDIPYPTPIVRDLSGTYNEGNMELSWTAPNWSFPEHETTSLYYVLSIPSYCVGYGGSYNMYWGHKYPVSLLESNEGKGIYKVSFFTKDSGVYQLFIYGGTVFDDEDDETGHPESLIQSKTANFSKIGWCDFVLDAPVVIDGDEDIWVFIYDPEFRSYPAYYNGSSEPVNGSFYIGCSPEYPYSPLNGCFIWKSEQYENSSFVIQTFLTDGVYSYNLYDGATQIAKNIVGTTYEVENVANNASHEYTVKTNYYGGETNPSNMVGLTLGATTISNLDLDEADKMVLDKDACLTISGELTNTNPANLILEDGAQLVNDSEGVQATVRRSIAGYGGNAKAGDDGEWNFIASPFTEAITPSDENGLTPSSGKYDLYRFNQSAELEWQNIKNQNNDFVSMVNKVGYLYASESDADIEISGTLEASDGTISLTYDDGKTFAGWNLVGNPFPCNAYPNRPYYTLNPSGTEVLAETVSPSTPVAPFRGIMVKAESDEQNPTLVFSKSAPVQTSSNIVLNVVKANVKDASVIDRAIVCMNQNREIGSHDLPKFSLKADGTKLYIPQNGTDYAIVNVAAKDENEYQEIPICFTTKEYGQYTISIDVENVDGEQIIFVDNLTGEIILLDKMLNRVQHDGNRLPQHDGVRLPELVSGTVSYTFTASATDYPSRFKLVLGEIQEPSQEINSGRNVFMRNGEIVVEEDGVEQVIDVTGRIVK